MGGHNCPKCDKWFRTNQELKKHFARKTPCVLICDRCNKTLSTYKYYKKHISETCPFLGKEEDDEVNETMEKSSTIINKTINNNITNNTYNLSEGATINNGDINVNISFNNYNNLIQPPLRTLIGIIKDNITELIPARIVGNNLDNPKNRIRYNWSNRSKNEIRVIEDGKQILKALGDVVDKLMGMVDKVVVKVKEDGDGLSKEDIKKIKEIEEADDNFEKDILSYREYCEDLESKNTTGEDIDENLTDKAYKDYVRTKLARQQAKIERYKKMKKELTKTLREKLLVVEDK